MQLKRKLLLLEDDAHIRKMIRQCLPDQEWEIAEVVTVAPHPVIPVRSPPA